MAGGDEPAVRADQQLAAVAAARAALAEAVSAGFLRHDPLRHVLAALSVSLDAMEAVLAGAVAATNAAVAEARRPIAPEMHQAAVVALVTEAVALFREEVARDNIRRRWTISLASVLGGMALAFAIGTGAYRAGWASADSSCTGGQMQIDVTSKRVICVRWLEQ